MSRIETTIKIKKQEPHKVNISSILIEFGESSVAVIPEEDKDYYYFRQISEARENFEAVDFQRNEKSLFDIVFNTFESKMEHYGKLYLASKTASERYDVAKTLSDEELKEWGS